MRITYIECECSHPQHVVRVVISPEDKWLEFALEPKGFWGRLKAAFGCLLGRRQVFVDCLLSKEQARKLAFAVDPDLGLELLSALGQDMDKLLHPSDIGSTWKYWCPEDRVFYYSKIVDVGCEFVMTQSLEKGEDRDPMLDSHANFLSDHERVS